MTDWDSIPQYTYRKYFGVNSFVDSSMPVTCDVCGNEAIRVHVVSPQARGVVVEKHGDCNGYASLDNYVV